MTWREEMGAGSKNWRSLSLSPDGSKIILTTNTYSYSSVDGGTSWIEQAFLGTTGWGMTAFSTDGSKYVTAISAGGSIYTSSLDTSPTPFTFTDQTGKALNTSIESSEVTIAGINTSSPISITSCTGTLCAYSINGGAYTAEAGTVSPGDTVKVRLTTSGMEGVASNLLLNIGGVTDTFSVTTGDFTPPVISLNGSSNIEIYQNQTYVDQGAVATDNIDGDVTAEIVTLNPVNTRIIGDYQVTYNVSDDAGNNAVEVTRRVVVSRGSSSGGSVKRNVSTSYTPTPVKTPLPVFVSSLLKKGMNNPEVMTLQKYLNSKGYFVSLSGVGSPGFETNYFGELTKKALIKFQKANGLVPDGIFGAKTREKMK